MNPQVISLQNAKSAVEFVSRRTELVWVTPDYLIRQTVRYASSKS
jgi:hypothetical protein